MKAAFLCNALDSSAALYNIFAHLAQSFEEVDAEVLHRGDLGALNSRDCPYDVLIYDSAWGAANVVAQLRQKERFKHVVFHHIHESALQMERKHDYLAYVKPQLVLATFDAMTEAVREWGLRCETIPFSFSTRRFAHLPYPSRFTIGYMGADMAHKGFDMVEKVALKMGVPCVGARRASHEGGEFKGREMDFYKQISCYVAVPTHESGPLPPIEAQLCGRPCVVTPVGMMPYIFANGAGGRLVEADEEGLRVAIEQVRDNFHEESEKAMAFRLPETAPLYEAAILSLA